jgi:N-acetylglucosaminyldiphosphoundecaprenol N-acetyl-beta-D-mannosaminyltransferase
VDAVSLEDSVRMLVNREFTGPIHLCNAYTLSLASKDKAFSQVLNRGPLNLPDGMPLVWIARRLGLTHMIDRVYGPDLMERVLDDGQAVGLRHYLYGSTQGVLTELQREIERRWPHAVIVGSESPPFRHITDAELRATVEKTIDQRADVVWVGMGTPTQDHLSQRMSDAGPGVLVSVGAAFDFIAGTKKQAPAWVRRAGLEWSHRLAMEPRRLWRRYIIGNTRFVLCVLRRSPTIATATG